MESIIKPKRPRIEGWRRLEDPPFLVSLGYPCEAWFHPADRFKALSAVEAPVDAPGMEPVPSYHLSISRIAKDGMPRRASLQDARQILRQFDMEGALEDNHVPGGVVRNFWRPVAEGLIGLECACKETEPAIVEDKGDYIWRGTNN